NFFRGKYLEAVKMGEIAIDKYQGLPGLIESELYFFLALSYLNLYSNANEEYQLNYRIKIRKSFENLENLHKINEENYSAKYYMIKAEIARINEDKFNAIEFYGKSIEASKRFEFKLEESIANELAGEFWNRINQNKYAEVHISQSIQKFSHFGLVLRVEFLKNKYPKIYSKNIEKSFSIYSSKSSAFFNSGLSSGNLLKSIDISSLHKSLTLVQKEGDLKEVINKINNILLENAGADRGVLAVKDPLTRVLTVYSDISINKKKQSDQNNFPVHSYNNIQKSIVLFTERTGKSTLILDAINDKKYSNDQYIQLNKIKSILSMPFIINSELIGVIYLENSLSEDVFTKERTEAIDHLISQMSFYMGTILKKYELSSYTNNRFIFNNEAFFNSKEKEILQLGNILNKNTTVVTIGLDSGSIQEKEKTIGQYFSTLKSFYYDLEDIIGDKYIISKKGTNKIQILMNTDLVSSIDYIKSIIEILESKDPSYKICSGIYNGNGFYSIIQNSKSFNNLFLSESEIISEVLYQVANYFGSEILILDSNFSDKMDLLNFDIRKLGNYPFNDSNSFICEILNKSKKIENKSIFINKFKEGVDHFWNKEFSLAKECFLLVKDGEDMEKTAQKFYDLCDNIRNESFDLQTIFFKEIN
ncbi:MAG: GAF domain-containing protein, partial [Leptospiraceae bacterium]|nr:GAF domain-containing protein [Leptospiraceae bacterium]